MLRILLAEDSYVIQRTLRTLLEGEPGIEIVGVASNGTEAVKLCQELAPDLVTMDIFMPEMDGLEATRKIMEQCPTRIVIISSMVGADNARMSFEAMRAGAIEVIEKPHGVLRGNYAAVKKSLVRVLTGMAQARPVGQISIVPPPPDSGPPPPLVGEGREQTAVLRTGGFPPRFTPEVICIGGSTGAPAVLVEVLSTLPADFPIPILVAQHISKGFAPVFTEWLDSSVAPRVKLAEHREQPDAGTVLISPDDHHLEFTRRGKIRLVPPRQEREHVPSINRFFESTARVYGEQALGVLLTGMGGDGAKGLRDLRLAGGATLAQDEETSVVYGMPKSARDNGAVQREVSPPRLAMMLQAMGLRSRSRS
jgi:two-component system chemotaxis response regulator CheB